AIVAVAVGGGGGGGGSDAPATTPPDNNGGTGTNNDNSPTCDDLNKVNKNPRPPVSNNPDNTPVCADLSGQWSGTEDLIGDNGLSITATIAQDGDKLQITTSSNKYGKVFIGTVDANCNINAYDQTTGEEWSTRYGPVTASRIALYDDISIECDGHSTSDSLILSR
ncbi:MAG TPA: hypothetical protein DEB25_02925, partial [Desulfobulbaceae bacterium]|nr:hypothetical protein [Desulfobulbaceae bacterium]